MRVRCPPTAFPAAHPPRTETSARPVSKSSSKEDYTIPGPSKRPHVGRDAAQTIRPKSVTLTSETGPEAALTAQNPNFRFGPETRPATAQQTEPAPMAASLCSRKRVSAPPEWAIRIHAPHNIAGRTDADVDVHPPLAALADVTCFLFIVY